jgi:hypothetical protein
MGRKWMGVARYALVAVVAVGIAFVGVAFIMPGEPISGTQSIAASVTPVTTPDRPSYLADVPSTSPYILEGEAPDVTTVPTVPQAQLKIAATATARSTDADPNAYLISASALNIREQPTSQSASLFVLERGTAVEVADTEGNWAQITDTEGRTGWAFLKFLARPGELPAEPTDALSE